MAKYTPPPLKDDETRLKPYDRLSRGAKQEMDLARRAELKKAEKDNEATPVSDTVAKILYASPLNFNSGHDIGRVDASADEKKARIQRAKDKADYKDMPNKTLYSDTVPEKLAKGGRVMGYRWYGKAKKV